MSRLPELTEPRDIVPIAVADGLVASARFDLALLAESVQRAEAEAEALERLVATTSSTVPPDEMVIYERLSGYFDQQALELDARRNEVIDRGRLEAEARLARANEEAARLLGPTSAASPADDSFVSMLTLDALPPATEAAEVTEPEVTEPEAAQPEAAQPEPDESEFAPPPVARRVAIEVGPVLEAPAVDDQPVVDDPPSDPGLAFGAPFAASPFAPVADAPVPDAPVTAATPAAAGSAVDKEVLENSGLDLTEFPDLLPILDAMLRGEPVPSAGVAAAVAAPEVAPEVDDAIPEVAAPEAEALAAPEAAAPEIANIPAPAPAPAPAPTPTDPLDHEARFSNFWEEQQAVEAKRQNTSIRPHHLLLPMVLIVLVVTFLLVWIG